MPSSRDRLDEWLGTAEELHPGPWRSEPNGNAFGGLPWLVLDTRGRVVARTSEAVADLLTQIGPWFDEGGEPAKPAKDLEVSDMQDLVNEQGAEIDELHDLVERLAARRPGALAEARALVASWVTP